MMSIAKRLASLNPTFEAPSLSKPPQTREAFCCKLFLTLNIPLLQAFHFCAVSHFSRATRAWASALKRATLRSASMKRTSCWPMPKTILRRCLSRKATIIAAFKSKNYECPRPNFLETIQLNLLVLWHASYIARRITFQSNRFITVYKQMCFRLITRCRLDRSLRH